MTCPNFGDDMKSSVKCDHCEKLTETSKRIILTLRYATNTDIKVFCGYECVIKWLDMMKKLLT